MHLAVVLTDAGAPVASAVPLDTVAVATLISFFVPLLVSLITKQTASDGLKSVVNIVATAVVAVISLFTVPLPPGMVMSWTLIANTFIGSIVASLVGYKGVWKPTGVTTTIEAKTANVGLGSPPVVQTDEKTAVDVAEGELDPAHFELGHDEDFDAPDPVPVQDFEWESIPAVDDYPPTLDREPENTPDEAHQAELRAIESRLTEIGDGPEGQAFRDEQKG